MGLAFALPTRSGRRITHPAAFAAVEEIQTPQSSGLGVSCRRRHPAWHRFCFVRFARENLQWRNRKGQNTGSDGSFIDQIALAPNSGLPELGMLAVEVGYIRLRWRRRRLHRCCPHALGFLLGFTVFERLDAMIAPDDSKVG